MLSKDRRQQPKAVGPVWLVLDGYEGTPVVRAALRLASLTFVRPGELRQARWAELSGRPEGRPFPPYWPLA